MCSEFQVNTSSQQIEDVLGTPVKVAGNETSWERTIKFSTPAPIVQFARDNSIELVERVFPVSPFPNSRLSGFANQSDGKDAADGDPEDRQIKRIYDMPRWKKTFADVPLLVPMTGFTEYAYWGEQEGSALNFTIPGSPLFFAAAIAIRPFVPKTNYENGFSILTHTATEQMLDYHHRLIVLLKPESALEYLNPMPANDRFDFLIANRYTGKLNVKKTRSMAKGWEKRVQTQIAKRDRELTYRNVLSSEHVEG